MADSDIKFSVKLKDNNYEEWLPGVKAMLTLRGYMGLVKGTKKESDFGSAEKFIDAKERAVALITLILDPSQYPLLGDSEDPKVVMDSIQKVNRACDFGSRFKMRRLWLSMQKREDQSMISWITSVEAYARRFRAIDANIENEEIIVVMVTGLPDSFESFIVSLDSIPTLQLTLEYVKGRLMNEFTCQEGPPDSAIIKQEYDEIPTRAMAAKYKDWSLRKKGDGRWFE